MEVNSPIGKKWLKFSANNLHQKFWSKQWEEYYVKRKTEYTGQMNEIIEKDVSRSCYTLEEFPKLQNSMRKELTELLHAYCAYDPELGYTQGMNFIVERLLAHLIDYQAFIVWIGILKTDDFRSCYTNNFGERLHKRFKDTIAEDIKLKFPILEKHIKKLLKANTVESALGGYESEDDPLFIFYALFTQIIMTLGCILPIHVKVKDQIITEFLQDRNKNWTSTTVLFGVLYVMENDILKCRDIGDVYQIMSSDSLKVILRGQDVLEHGHIVRTQYPLLTARQMYVNMDSPIDIEIDDFWMV